MEEVKKQIEKWLSFCDRSYSAATIKTYRCVIYQMLRCIEKNGQQLSSSSIEDFLDSKYKAGGSRKQFNTYRMILRSFCNWRQRKYEIPSPANNIPKIREGNTSPRVLTEEEYKFIVDFVSGTDRDILLFLGNTGLRKSEFASLKWGDVNPQFIRVLGKGRKTRVVPLNNTCREVLQKYKRLANDEPLQISQRYPGPENCSWLCRRISRKTGMPKFGSHAIRHRFATQLIRKGISIYKVSKILGHASIKITSDIYVHLVPQDLFGTTDCLQD